METGGRDGGPFCRPNRALTRAGLGRMGPTDFQRTGTASRKRQIPAASRACRGGVGGFVAALGGPVCLFRPVPRIGRDRPPHATRTPINQLDASGDHPDHHEAIMAKSELGTKRTDPETGKKFYDLNRDPIVSPFTGKTYPLSFFETVEVSRSSAAAAKAKAKAAAAKQAADEEEEEDEDDTVEIEQTDNTVSLNDVEEEEGTAKAKAKTDVDETDDEDATADDDDDDAAYLPDDEDDDDDVSDIIGGGRDDDED
ncbi:conserved hypothetical protein, FYDLN_acid family [Aurantimonas manganoxydans SI85-9A1]|uniref:TIGR02300 family protein n=2 Tax=Aurantimonas manganoxydans TaxID=651183 RepID=Q1YE74_AURMS|nr:conserved hypothetical protein, FYDLN_acid family [Aurantimonas manganoxydans SI85-9A1]